VYAWREDPPSKPNDSVPPASGVATSLRTDSGMVVRCMPLSVSAWFARPLTSSIPTDGTIVTDVAPNTPR
jgi:hypothetical protein